MEVGGGKHRIYLLAILTRILKTFLKQFLLGRFLLLFEIILNNPVIMCEEIHFKVYFYVEAIESTLHFTLISYNTYSIYF